jgi:hypothetical protein
MKLRVETSTSTSDTPSRIPREPSLLKITWDEREQRIKPIRDRPFEDCETEFRAGREEGERRSRVHVV